MEKQNLKIRFLSELKDMLVTMLGWGAMFNLFLFVPLAFFKVIPLGLVFGWSCVLFAITACLIIVNIIRNNMKREKIISEVEKLSTKFEEMLKEKFEENLNDIEIETKEDTDKEEV